MAKPVLLSGEASRGMCDGCLRRRRPALVQVGEPHPYEPASANLCRECLLAALALLPNEDVPATPAPKDTP